MASPFISHAGVATAAPPQHLLIPLDDSPTNVVYIRHGLALAKELNAHVTFMHVLESMREDVEDEEHRQGLLVARKKKSERAQRITRQLADAAQVPYQVIESEGDPAFLITHFLCDLIVMGSHSRKPAERHTVGTVTDTVLQLSSVPVIAVRCPTPSVNSNTPAATSTSPNTIPNTNTSTSTAAYKRILVSYDGTFLAENALLHVMPIAQAIGAALTLVYVLEAHENATDGSAPSPAHAKHRQVIEGFLTRGRDFSTHHGVSCDILVHESPLHPADALVHVAAAFDLVVLATHGRRGLERKLLGSVTEGVLRLAEKPVFVVGRKNLHKEQGDQAIAANHALSVD